MPRLTRLLYFPFPVALLFLMRPFIYQRVKHLRYDVSSAIITATELAAILYRYIDDIYKQHHKINSKFSQHLILMVSPLGIH